MWSGPRSPFLGPIYRGCKACRRSALRWRGPKRPRRNHGPDVPSSGYSLTSTGTYTCSRAKRQGVRLYVFLGNNGKTVIDCPRFPPISNRRTKASNQHDDLDHQKRKRNLLRPKAREIIARTWQSKAGRLQIPWLIYSVCSRVLSSSISSSSPKNSNRRRRL